MKKIVLSIMLVMLGLFVTPSAIYAAEDDNPYVEPVELPKDNGQVLFKANVHPSINDLKVPVFIELISTNGYEGIVHVEPLNSYELFSILPVGDYQFKHAGVDGDYKNTYHVEGVAFTVKKDNLTNVEFDVGDPNAKSHIQKDTEVETESHNSDELVSDSSINNDNYSDMDEHVIVETESAVEGRKEAEYEEKEGTSSFVVNNKFTIFAMPLLVGALLVFKILKK